MAPAAAAAASQRGTGSLRGRVLVVEDNVVNQKVAVGMLRIMGLESAVAENGEQALAALGEGGFDLILMDCQMPVLDGYETTRRLRAQPPPGARLPVIALTANALAEDAQRCLDAGMDDYLAKPVDAARLRAKIARWLGARPGGSGAAPA